MKQPDAAAPSCPLSHRIVARTSKLIIMLLIAAVALSLIYIALTQRS